MAAFSTYLGNALLDEVCGGVDFSAPATVYAALFVGDPQGAGSEVSAGGYARQSASFGSASGLSVDNDAEIEFGPATASWGTVDYAALYDASSNGNLLVSGALSSSKTIESDDKLNFAVGNLSVSFT
jgi:hypothetical protein